MSIINKIKYKPFWINFNNYITFKIPRHYKDTKFYSFNQVPLPYNVRFLFSLRDDVLCHIVYILLK